MSDNETFARSYIGRQPEEMRISDSRLHLDEKGFYITEEVLKNGKLAAREKVYKNEQVADIILGIQDQRLKDMFEANGLELELGQGKPGAAPVEDAPQPKKQFWWDRWRHLD